MVSDFARVAPGASTSLRLSLVNKTNTKMMVRLLYDDQSRPLDLETRDAHGATFLPPPGQPEVDDKRCAGADCTVAMGQVTLAPGGEAHALLTWTASVLAWIDGASLKEIDGRRPCRVRERGGRAQKGKSDPSSSSDVCALAAS